MKQIHISSQSLLRPGDEKGTNTLDSVPQKGIHIRVPGQCARFWSRLGRKSWTAETCSCIFSSLSLLGLVATLLAHQNKPIPHWPQLVSINSIVSLFSLLMRAGVSMVLAEGISQSKWQWFRKARKLSDMERFDSASRGAWGSIMLLVSLRPGRLYWIAALGAFITVMAALTGFTSQQLVQFAECPQPDEAAAVAVWKTNAYGSPIGGGGYAPFEIMAAAMEVGIIQPVEDLTGTLSRGCNTGNCTFPSTNNASFSSVGISHTCEDVMSQVRETPINGTSFWANLTSPNPGQNFSVVGLRTGDFNDSLATGAGGGPGMLSAVHMVFNRKSEERNYTAISCSIYPSINTYGVRITNAVLEETLLESVPIGNNLGRAYDRFVFPWKRVTSYTLRNGIREACKQQDNPSTVFAEADEANVDAAPRITSEIKDWGTETTYPPEGFIRKKTCYPGDCIWTFGLAAATETQEYLEGIFNEQRLAWSDGGYTGSIHLRTLYQAGNMNMDTVEEFMSNLTTAMTAVVRTYGSEGEPAGRANGTMWYMTTCVQIRWSWMSFPVVMIGLTAVFLVLVQIENRGTESERLWKSSILAMLFCEVDNAVTEGTKLIGRRSMKEMAKSTSVSLETNSQTMKLVAREASKSAEE